MRLGILLGLLVFLAVPLLHTAHAIDLSVVVDPVVEGRTFFVNHTAVVNRSVEKFWVYWENWGSTECTYRLRADIYNTTNKTEQLVKNNEGKIDTLSRHNQKKRVYTAWSAAVPLNTGENNNLMAYWYPYNISGDFTAQLRVYGCNEIFELDPVEITSIGWGDYSPDKGNIIIKSISVQKDNVGLEILPLEDISEAYVFAEDYPYGWIFENAKIEGLTKGKIANARINFTASVFLPKNAIISVLGAESYAKKEIELKETTDPKYALAAIFLFVFAAAFLGGRKVKQKSK